MFMRYSIGFAITSQACARIDTQHPLVLDRQAYSVAPIDHHWTLDSLKTEVLLNFCQRFVKIVIYQ